MLGTGLPPLPRAKECGTTMSLNIRNVSKLKFHSNDDYISGRTWWYISPDRRQHTNVRIYYICTRTYEYIVAYNHLPGIYVHHCGRKYSERLILDMNTKRCLHSCREWYHPALAGEHRNVINTTYITKYTRPCQYGLKA